MSANALLTGAIEVFTGQGQHDGASQRLRDRLRAAGLLAGITELSAQQPPDNDEFEQARRDAASGFPLSELIAQGRG